MTTRRNFACPFYDSCLSQAISQQQNDFDCLGCPRKDEVRSDWPEVQERDSHRVMSLFAAICRNRVRPSSKPLTEDELSFLWDEPDGGGQTGAAGNFE